MNRAMEQTEEYIDGQLKHKYGDTFIRGNNVLYISAQPKKWGLAEIPEMGPEMRPVKNCEDEFWRAVVVVKGCKNV